VLGQTRFRVRRVRASRVGFLLYFHFVLGMFTEE
jgi:hypothetical protein